MIQPFSFLTQKNQLKKARKIGVFLLGAFLFIILSVVVSNQYVVNSSKMYLFNSVQEIPQNNVGLVLGTSSGLSNGRPNLYFTYRINAAADLFKAGKVKHLIVSGDNHIKNYNEPEEMRLALIGKGVPDSCITMDFAGFRTLDSVVRCQKVFGQTKFTIISQQFHNQRAVFLARQKGLDAIGYNAKDVHKSLALRTKVREPLARFKAVLDILFNMKPKFLGEQVKIKV
jgi:SanA protein